MSYNYADMIRTTAYRNGETAYFNHNDKNPYKTEYEIACWNYGYNMALTFDRASVENEFDDYDDTLEPLDDLDD